MAVQASLTGHLVLSTLHTNDAPSAITRLLDLGVPFFLLQSTVAGVVAQRLVRKLCHHCKQPGEVDEAKWKLLTDGFGFPVPAQLMRPVGCTECRRTGYLGRTAIYEMMPLTGRLRGLLSKDLELPKFRAAALADGMRPLRLSAAEQVAKGITTLEEVLAALPPGE